MEVDELVLGLTVPQKAVVLRRADARRPARPRRGHRAADHAGVRDLGRLRPRRGGRRRRDARLVVVDRPHEQRAAPRLPAPRRARRHAAERELGAGHLRLRPEHRRGDARHRRAGRRAGRLLQGRGRRGDRAPLGAVRGRPLRPRFQGRWMVPITVGSKRKPAEIDADWGIRPAPLEALEGLPRRDRGRRRHLRLADASGRRLRRPDRHRRQPGPTVRLLASGFARVGTRRDAEGAGAGRGRRARRRRADARRHRRHQDPQPVRGQRPLVRARDRRRRRRDEPVRLQPDLRPPAGPDRRARHRRADLGAARPRRRPRAVHRLRRRRHRRRAGIIEARGGAARKCRHATFGPSHRGAG